MYKTGCKKNGGIKKIIAIDPDTERNGVAVLNTNDKKINVYSLSFVSLLEFLSDQGEKDTLVIVEAGYLNKSNWHIKLGQKANYAAAIGNATGRNHERARAIVELCRDYLHFETVERLPLKKIWKGEGGKITAEELKEITGITQRTNQDERDAALLAWKEAGFELKKMIWNL